MFTKEMNSTQTLQNSDSEGFCIIQTNMSMNGFGQVWNLLTQRERELIIHTGVRLVANEYNGYDAYDPANKTIYVSYANHLDVIKSELVHILQDSRDLLNAGYDKSVEYEQNISYYFYNEIHGTLKSYSPVWMSNPRASNAFIEWVASCIKDGRIDWRRFCEKNDNFFQSSHYEILNRVWEDEKQDIHISGRTFLNNWVFHSVN